MTGAGWHRVKVRSSVMLLREARSSLSFWKKRHLYPGCCPNHLSTLRETSPKTLKRRVKKRIPEKWNQSPHSSQGPLDFSFPWVNKSPLLLKTSKWIFYFIQRELPIKHGGKSTSYMISKALKSFTSTLLSCHSPVPTTLQATGPPVHCTDLVFLLWCCQHVFSPSVCCCPSSLTLTSPQHSTLTLTRPTDWPSRLSIPALTCLRPVQFQQPRKRSRGGQSGCELEIVLGATGKCCIWSPSTVTSWRKLYNRLVGISSFSRLPWWLSGKESSCQCRRHGFDPWIEMIAWRREWRPTPVFLPGEFHGQRSLVGYSP